MFEANGIETLVEELLGYMEAATSGFPQRKDCMMSTTQFPRHEIFGDPIIDLTYKIDINSEPSNVWPWIVQVGYHRAGWYIDIGDHVSHILQARN
jgi:hypothetical protein